MIKTFFKTITWRLIATATTFTIAFVITGEIQLGLTISGIEFFAKMILYFFHEEIWKFYKKK